MQNVKIGYFLYEFETKKDVKFAIDIWDRLDQTDPRRKQDVFEYELTESGINYWYVFTSTD